MYDSCAKKWGKEDISYSKQDEWTVQIIMINFSAEGGLVWHEVVPPTVLKLDCMKMFLFLS